MKTYNGIERPDHTPELISELKADEVFVFGSNLEGMHGGGAAFAAWKKFGAVKNHEGKVYLTIRYANSGSVKQLVNTGETYRLDILPASGWSIHSVTYNNVVMNVYVKAVKRVCDILLSIIGIIVFAIPMLIVAILIKLDSKGPVIFKQERVGLNGRHFKMYKFRSMVADAEAMKKELADKNKVSSGLMFKMEDDPRITKVGKFIRKTSIDELPQFFNVLFGTMSLVGTRPPTVDEVAQYDTRHWRRLSIKPGITGMWQTSGRSEITDFEEVVALDKEYIDNWSLWLDLKIMFKTVFQVFFKQKGAY